ncbi:MAG: SPOR domain-containing protein [Hydrogenophaga sp.]|nr:SPOR domain-containing protein [Hydrogenophaga sp.]
MFKSRSAAPGSAAAQPPQSIEAVRRRARHRLIGASVLVLLGVLGFPLLFDTQPRPISVDIPIEIPAKNQASGVASRKAAPTSPAVPPVPESPAAEVRRAAEPSAPALSAQESLSAREEMVSEPARPAPTPRPDPAPEARPAAPATVAAAAPVAAAPARPSAAAEAARAKALLDGKPVAQTTEAAERIVVQVGAFADAARAREVRLKVEAAGLKTYTHVAQTAEGSRIRVRVGPFATRAEADRAAARVKALGLPAAILTL